MTDSLTFFVAQTEGKADTAYEKTSATASSVGQSIKSTAESAVETVKANVPSGAALAQPSSASSSTGNTLAQEGSILAHSKEARHEASVPSSSTAGTTSTSPLVEQAHSTQARLSETAHHAFDLARSYLPESLGGASTTTTSIPAFTVVSSSSEEDPAVAAGLKGIEPEGVRANVQPAATGVSSGISTSTPQPSTASASHSTPLTESAPAAAQPYAQAAVDKVREIGNKAAEYLPSGKKQEEVRYFFPSSFRFHSV